MREDEASTYRYWAFISYSSTNSSWARWLHRAIEMYGIPARLVRHPTPAGEPAPKRFRPVFHDRAELSASADLGTAIDAALSASRYLIVVCSPSAARSNWVNKEVEAFQRLGRSDRVLAVIVEGEPNAGDERECFPPALRSVEPVAVDARRQGDQRGDVKLRLLAGMLGVGFDDLKHRATQRRIRRLQAAVAAALVLAAAFAGVAWYAQAQRNRAERARQQAETVIEYLVYNLRDQLEFSGRLDVARDAQDVVDAYYRGLGAEEYEPQVARDGAVSKINEGDRLLAENDAADALKEYQAALSIFNRLASARTGDVVLDRDVSVAHIKVGDALRTADDLAGARAEYSSALVISEKLASSAPDSMIWQLDLGVAHNRLGDTLLRMGNFESALGQQSEALRIAQRLAASGSGNVICQQAVYAAQCGVADVLAAQGDETAALRGLRPAIAVMERLASANPGNLLLQRDLAAGHGQMSLVLGLHADRGGALREAQTAVAIMRRLVASDPENAAWRQELATYQDYESLALRSQRESGK
jgi:tetratricopeptide (TPR) repeat protein